MLNEIVMTWNKKVFTGGDDGRDEIAVGQGLDGPLRIKLPTGTVHCVIRRAANIAVTTSAHTGAIAVASISSSWTSKASATTSTTAARDGRRCEPVTGRRVRTHITTVAGETGKVK